MKGLKPEDYLEPTCIFCTPEDERATPVDLRRCFTRLDEYLDRNYYAAAERHLDYWWQEAVAGRDWRGLLSIENERMGLFRKLGKQPEALESVRSALELVDRAGLDDTVTAATTWLNVGTVYKNFQEPRKALPWYEKARAVYERELPAGDCRLGGLYNNTALVLTDLGRFDEAKALYLRALEIMGAAEDGRLEMAVTELNLADLAAASKGLLEAEDEIEAHLDRAEALLEEPGNPRSGYYAFVCEKCAPSFGYYGRFAYAEELQARAKRIYEGN